MPDHGGCCSKTCAVVTALLLVALASFLYTQDFSLRKSFSATSSSTKNGTILVNKSAVLPIEGIEGQWIFQENRTFNTGDICCPWDKDILPKVTSSVKTPSKVSYEGTFPFDKSICGPHKWSEEERLFYSGRNDFFAQVGGNGCTCQPSFQDKYVWKSPLLDAFDPDLTCRLLRNRTVLLLGDSTMSQAASTLMNAVFPAKCQIQINFAHSDTLIKENFGAMNRGWHWWDVFEKQKPDIYIISTGAHIARNENFTTVIETVLSTIKTYRETEGDHTAFVYKTLQPAGCMSNISLEPPDLVGQRHSFDNYNWDKFYSRDLFAISRFRSLNVPVMDLRMLYSRGDAHICSLKNRDRGCGDCMHTCYPGPLDVVPQVFQNLLQKKLFRQS